MGTVGFSVDGEWLTNHYRERWVETGYDSQIVIDLMKSLNGGFTVEHADAVLSGRMKLTGVNSLNAEEDNATEVCGIALLTIDEGKAYRTNLGVVLGALQILPGTASVCSSHATLAA